MLKTAKNEYLHLKFSYIRQKNIPDEMETILHITTFLLSIYIMNSYT